MTDWSELYTDIAVGAECTTHGTTWVLRAIGCLHETCWIMKIRVNGTEHGMKLYPGDSKVVDGVTFYAESVSTSSATIIVSGGSDIEQNGQKLLVGAAIVFGLYLLLKR